MAEKKTNIEFKVLKLIWNLWNYTPIDLSFQCKSFSAKRLKKYFIVQKIPSNNMKFLMIPDFLIFSILKAILRRLSSSEFLKQGLKVSTSPRKKYMWNKKIVLSSFFLIGLLLIEMSNIWLNSNVYIEFKVLNLFKTYKTIHQSICIFMTLHVQYLDLKMFYR